MGKSEHLHFSARKPFYKQLTHRKAFFNWQIIEIMVIYIRCAKSNMKFFG
jgi:hypothetical protein